jgi:hypothetical protein
LLTGTKSIGQTLPIGLVKRWIGKNRVLNLSGRNSCTDPGNRYFSTIVVSAVPKNGSPPIQVWRIEKHLLMKSKDLEIVAIKSFEASFTTILMVCDLRRLYYHHVKLRILFIHWEACIRDNSRSGQYPGRSNVIICCRGTMG